jgi:ABC-type nitrate/sulfonate/bicarbonate transport system substrate-binding protein
MMSQGESRQMRQLRVIVFNGAWNLPIWIAESEGFFAEERLEVKVAATKSSGALMQALYGGDVEIALAGADNFLAYEAGMGEVAVKGGERLRIIMGGDGGFLKLVARSQFQSVEHLRGQVIGVDAFTTGFAFVAREILRRKNITESEVEWEPLGGTESRYAAFLQGRCDATLLRLPYELMAQAHGARVLASGEELGRFQGTTGAVRKTWAEQNAHAVIAFLRAYRAALEWIAQPDNRSGAIEQLRVHLDIPDPVLADSVLDQLLAPNGLQPDMRVDPKGLATVVELRRRYGGLAESDWDADDLIDDTYLNAVMA